MTDEGSEYIAVQQFINGTWRDGRGDRAIQVKNPANGKVLAEVRAANAADIDDALQSASVGFEVWRRTPAVERAEVLLRAAQLLRERANAVARAITTDQGKPLAEAHGEIANTIAVLEWDAAEARRIYGVSIPAPRERRYSVEHVPIGPVAAFSPWNFPIQSPGRKIAASLATGCSVILKPSEETPGGAIELVRCFEDAGVPPGVINLLLGVPDEISRQLIASPVVRLVTLTGSVPVGKHLAGLAAANMKPAVMELGGHAPTIVCDDADLEATVATGVTAKYRNAGQVCVSPTRFLVEDTVFDEFLSLFAKAAAEISVGNGLSDGVKMGPLANERRVATMSELLRYGALGSGDIVLGGEPLGGGGWLYEPTVVTNVPTEAPIMTREPFGPVAVLNRFADLRSAIAEANRLPYGLAAYAFTTNERTARYISEKVEAGVIAINHFAVGLPDTPFGGVKDSGYGREGGAEGLTPFLTTKFTSHAVAEFD
jgi:succinate-semialdehyde dehydrogenase / glutarate-semialdehyde dehydrogenase